jgi:hypothetical protein
MIPGSILYHSETAYESAIRSRRLLDPANGGDPRVDFGQFRGVVPMAHDGDSLRTGWLCFALFVPGGLILVFLGIRGRADELQAVSSQTLATEFAGGCAVELLLSLLILGITSLFTLL